MLVEVLNKETTKEFVELFMRIAFLKHKIYFLLKNLVHCLISDINKSDLLLAVPLYNLLPINIKILDTNSAKGLRD
ncbi:hypothetical protein BS21228_22030 [Bacillus subtilis]|nr:hypothetical protein BS21228_22030 [Bacillus subtilis]